MLILIALLLLFLIPVVILVLNQTQVKTGYAWFLALSAAFVAWLLLWFASSKIPAVIPLLDWQAEGLFPAAFTLFLDPISWPYALVVVTLSLVVLLTDVLEYGETDPNTWASVLAITGLGVLAILAKNPITLIFTWAAMDISETLMLLQRVSTSSYREKVVIAFSMRAVGVLLVLSAALRTRFLGAHLTFEQIPLDVRWYLLLAAGLRLGVFPPHQPFFHEPTLRRGLGTIVRLVPVASSLTLLARVADAGAMQKGVLPLLLGAALAALYGGLAWVRAKDELDGRPNWILGIAAFSFIASLRGLSDASVAWGLALIVSGGMLFLMSLPGRQSLILGLVGLVSVSMLPFTPHWQAVAIYTDLSILFVIVFMLAQIILLFGFLRHLLSKLSLQSKHEAWMLIIYPLGLTLLPLTHWGETLLGSGITRPDGLMLALPWWGGAFILGLVAALIVASRRNISLPPQLVAAIGTGLSLRWFYQSLWWGYRTVSKLFSAIASILEGEGGILWAILFMLLLFAVLQQWGGGLQP